MEYVKWRSVDYTVERQIEGERDSKNEEEGNGVEKETAGKMVWRAFLWGNA